MFLNFVGRILIKKGVLNKMYNTVKLESFEHNLQMRKKNQNNSFSFISDKGPVKVQN